MPFISICPVGGRKRSPYCDRASRSERDTSMDVVVVQSTSSGNKPINCSQATLSTEMKNRIEISMSKNSYKANTKSTHIWPAVFSSSKQLMWQWLS